MKSFSPAALMKTEIFCLYKPLVFAAAAAVVVVEWRAGQVFASDFLSFLSGLGDRRMIRLSQALVHTLLTLMLMFPNLGVSCHTHVHMTNKQRPEHKQPAQRAADPGGVNSVFISWKIKSEI